MICGHLLKIFGGDIVIYPSPLRYPGGKKKLANFISDAIVLNDIQGGTYIEPFAGGSNVALFLLFQEQVSKIVINDVDRSIYAFWHSVIYNTDKLCERIIETQITIQEWEKQKEIQRDKEKANLLDLGFSTFFLNRTNRSGIINAGPIGGKKQNGNWKIDVRFNKDDLINRIKKIALYESRINLYNKDAIALINEIISELDEHCLIYFDPPYYNQGSSLYTNFYKHEDHEILKDFIMNLNCKWILTYDYTPDIINMYRLAEKRLLTLGYTAAKKMKGNEMIAFCEGFIIPQSEYSAITIE